MIAPLQRRVLLMVARGVIKTVKDTGKIQKMQVLALADEVIDGLDRIQQVGFTSRPKAGAQAVVLFMGGNRDHGVVIATDDGSVRPKDLGEGEAAVYSYGGYQVRVLASKIQIGKAGTWETMVVGEKLAELLGSLLGELITHTHPAPGAPPTNAAAFTTMKADYITNDKILAKDGGRF
jgi:phage gp45-like